MRRTGNWATWQRLRRKALAAYAGQAFFAGFFGAGFGFRGLLRGRLVRGRRLAVLVGACLVGACGLARLAAAALAARARRVGAVAAEHLLGQHHVLGNDARRLRDRDPRLGLAFVGIGQQQLADGLAQRGLGVALEVQVFALPEQPEQGVDDGLDQCGFDGHACFSLGEALWLRAISPVATPARQTVTPRNDPRRRARPLTSP